MNLKVEIETGSLNFEYSLMTKSHYIKKSFKSNETEKPKMH